MKYRTIATALILFVLLFFMIWSFGSSAANVRGISNESNPASENNPAEGFQESAETDVDADLGKWGSSRIDREEYLTARGDYVARKRGIEPGRPFNPQLRQNAIEQMERQEKGRRLEQIVSGDIAPAAGGAWTAIGPSPLPNGVGTTPASGRITSIAVDPGSPNKVYLGTAQGGVWRSTDGGSSWTAIFDTADSLAIGAVALAPSNPSILYVGTGEFNGCGDCFFGVGLYRIDNVDTSPSLVGPINPSQTIGGLTYNIFTGRSISKILVHPADPATVFIATARGTSGSGANGRGLVPAIATRGVYRITNAWPTTDQTAMIVKKLTVTTGNSFPTESPQSGDEDIPDMAMEPGNPDTIIAAAIGPSGTGLPSAIYRTTNATAATPTFVQALALGNNIRVSLAINKTGSAVTVYAATSETPTNTAGCTTANSGAIRKSTDGGASWSSQLTGGGGFCSGQCFYDMPIAVDPADANLVYIGGQTSSTCGGVVRRATDGGNGATGNSFTNDSTGLHADNHAIVFDSANNVYVGTDGGVWRQLKTSTTWTNLNNAPLNTLQFESIAVHPTDQFLMIGGTQDNGTEFQQTSSGNWRNTEGGDGGYALIDQSATDTINVTYYHTFFNQTGNQLGFDRTNLTSCLPCKNSWESRGPGAFASGTVPLCNGTFSTTSCDGTPAAAANGINLSDSVLFYAPMALGPGSPNTVYFGSDRLYRSNDRGDTMTVVSQAPISGTSPISTIGIWRGGDNVRLVGLQNGQVWATSTGSSTLVNLAPPIPANPSGSTINKFIGRAMIDPNNKNVAYITLSYYAPAGQGIWKITNLAAAASASPAAPVWQAAGNGIPSIPINAFAIDPINSNNLYAGTDIGVYFSSDGGATWSPYGTGLPKVAVFDLQIQPTFRILRAATHGRGIWENPLVSPAPSTIQFSAGASAVAEGQVSTTVTITRSGDTSFPASVNYATTDTSGANGCGTNTGAASSRCDYIATSGTLNFAAGENTKNVSIPIWNDSYVEGPESFSVVLSNVAGNNVSLGPTPSITITINDSAFTGPNQIDTTGFYVREQYIDFLNREPDTSGFNFWVNNIDSCGADVGCREVRRIDTSAAFFLSIEFQQTGYLVERIYKAAFGDGTGSSSTGGTHTLRVPVIRLNEFLPDTQRIGQGVIVGQGNWQQQIEDNKQAFTEEFVQRARFQTALPLSLTSAQFVDALNTNARANNNVMPLSAAERDNLVNALNAGTMTRAQVLRAVAEDPDLFNSETNRAFVLMEYFGYLRRNPNDPQDTDYAGFEFWLNKLNQFNGSYVNAEMVKAFTTSIEYRKRFAQ